MKSYTDKKQSKKLAEILSNKTSDMYYWCGENIVRFGGYKDQNEDYDIPCWSLAALLDVYPMCVGRDLGMFCCWVNHKSMCSSHFDNPVDACVDMISLLKERSLI